jgi:hypothetical protein
MNKNKEEKNTLRGNSFALLTTMCLDKYANYVYFYSPTDVIAKSEILKFINNKELIGPSRVT